MSRDGLTSVQLQRGHYYRLPGFIGAGYVVIQFESIGLKMVRYRGWDGESWSSVEYHPRVLFDSWNGAWIETEDPRGGDE